MHKKGWLENRLNDGSQQLFPLDQFFEILFCNRHFLLDVYNSDFQFSFCMCSPVAGGSRVDTVTFVKSKVLLGHK